MLKNGDDLSEVEPVIRAKAPLSVHLFKSRRSHNIRCSLSISPCVVRSFPFLLLVHTSYIVMYTYRVTHFFLLPFASLAFFPSILAIRDYSIWQVLWDPTINRVKAAAAAISDASEHSFHMPLLFFHGASPFGVPNGDHHHMATLFLQGRRREF